MSVERPRRLPPGMKAPPPRPPGNPRKGFAFPHAQGVTLRSPQKWSCPRRNRGKIPAKRPTRGWHAGCT